MPCLLDLSLEINQMIALEIEDDTDLQSYRLSCHFANNAADGDNGSFWRRRFLEQYDHPSPLRLANKEYKKKYIKRQHRLGLVDIKGKTKSCHEKKCLEILRDIVAESFTVLDDSPQVQNESKNMVIINKFIHHGLLDRVFDKRNSRGRGPATKADLLLYTIQLTLTHASLNANPMSSIAMTMRFHESQQIAYTTASQCPIFSAVGQVDVEWTLHMANFFKYHFLRANEQLQAPYAALADCERPQCWAKMLQDGPSKLGKLWKGSYAFVDRDEIEDIRAGRNGEDVMTQDQLNGEEDEDGFQTLRLDFLNNKAADWEWPATFERILQARSKAFSSAKTRAQKRATGHSGNPAGEPIAFRFQGKGKDNAEPFHATGWLNPLPPQQGIPGWQRLTMMKYYVQDEAFASPLSAIEDSLWAYEGVVLPGGMIVLGRWWHPEDVHIDDQYSGPFILWNIDTSIVETKSDTHSNPKAKTKAEEVAIS